YRREPEARKRGARTALERIRRGGRSGGSERVNGRGRAWGRGGRHRRRRSAAEHVAGIGRVPGKDVVAFAFEQPRERPDVDVVIVAAEQRLSLERLLGGHSAEEDVVDGEELVGAGHAMLA